MFKRPVGGVASEDSGVWPDTFEETPADFHRHDRPREHVGGWASWLAHDAFGVFLDSLPAPTMRGSPVPRGSTVAVYPPKHRKGDRVEQKPEQRWTEDTNRRPRAALTIIRGLPCRSSDETSCTSKLYRRKVGVVKSHR